MIPPSIKAAVIIIRKPRASGDDPSATKRDEPTME